jgi:signal transduction histidine kinase
MLVGPGFGQIMSVVALAHLTPTSTLAELPAVEFSVDESVLGSFVAEQFERRREAPGVIILSRGQFAGMLARPAFFQHMSRQFSREIYLCRPIGGILNRGWPAPLRLPAQRRISEAAELALSRPQSNAYDPIVVDHGGDENLRLLDMHVVLQAQARLLTLTQVAMVESEKLASVGQLAAGMAHEINNPLAFVINNLAVLQRDVRGVQQLIDLYARGNPTLKLHDPALSTDVAELCEQLDLNYLLPNLRELIVRSRDGLRRIQEIVRGLRDFARLDESDLHEVDLNEGIQSTVHMIEGRARDKGVKLELFLSPSLPRVACYPAKINQVVLNLVANAIDACPANADARVVVRSELKDDSTAPQARPPEVSIEVSDTGVGIDPTVRGRLFEPFFTTKPPGQGTGLGLSISYGVVRDHGGAIDVETEAGRGSTFRVRLPLSPPRPAQTAPSQPTETALAAS